MNYTDVLSQLNYLYVFSPILVYCCISSKASTKYKRKNEGLLGSLQKTAVYL